MSNLVLQLPDSVASELARVGQETDRSSEAVAQDMIQRMVALRKVDKLRSDISRDSRSMQPDSEDEILSSIS